MTTKQKTKRTANRKYKDSVFTLLFGDLERLKELLGAIFDTTYGDDVKIEIATLDDVLYMTFLNDIACIVDGKLIVLIEHQSTINENMPLRMLIYVSSVYKMIVDNETLYRKTITPIPRPEFIVLYNGTDDMPDEQTLRLSDMFIKCGDDEKKTLGRAAGDIDLELAVKVYNINKGRNRHLAQKSPTLDGYETFVAKAREFEKVSKSRDEAIRKAIDYCIENNILKQFMESNSKEVINMLTMEWDMDTALRVSKEEGMRTNALKTARTLKSIGKMTVDEIAMATGLTVDDILRM